AGPADVERPVSLAAARSALGGGCLLAFLAVAGRLHVLVVRGRGATLLPLGPLSAVAAVLQRVRADLDAAALAVVPPPMRAVVLRSLAGGLGRLDEALWRPAASLAGDGPVLVVPTAALGAVPWTLLPGLRGRPVTVAPSATSWLAARERPPAPGPPVFAVGPGVPRGETEVRAAAAAWSTHPAAPPPAVGVPVDRATGVSVGPATGVSVDRATGMSAGPAAGVSVGSATGLSVGPATGVSVGPSAGPEAGGRGRDSDVPVLTGAAATGGAVLAAAARARLLHVAAHGVHDADNPLFSSLQLADGPLFGYDLPRAAALPSHVVLSACDLGLAEVRPGDEALGMTSALLHGGVASVVAGVARVGDEVAATAMVAYHHELAAGHTPAVALAAALAGLDPDHPAPLVTFGAGW
ncbi:MAG TPA: CHAT domain-containing protein, partial [Pseudonocardiaceae bacterium]